MKIALIGQSFDKNSGQGVHEYSNYLYENFKKTNKNEKIEKIETGTSKNPFITLWKNLFVSFYKTLRTKADIYHFMMPEICLACIFKRPSVVTVHDIIPLLINERKRIFNIYFKFMIKIALRANHIIAVSESTKRDLIKRLRIPEEKISIIHEGVNHKKFYPKRIKNRKKFVMGYLGGFGKRKNLGFILKLAKEFEKDRKVFFKLAGKGPEKERLENMVKNLGLNNVEFVGFVPDEELNNFYNSLDLFLFPSLYEGFGLPVLEAMACGIPVMVSNIGSLPEIVGDVGMIISINNLIKTKEDIEKIIKNKKIRQEMKNKGIKRTKEFSWDKTINEIIKVYKSI